MVTQFFNRFFGGKFAGTESKKSVSENLLDSKEDAPLDNTGDVERFVDPNTGLQGLRRISDKQILLPASYIMIKESYSELIPMKCAVGRRILYGYADKEGNIRIPCRYSFAHAFNNGVAFVRNQYDKWGLIDENGKWLIYPQYEAVGIFKHGVAAVRKSEYGKWGLINKNGEELSNFIYDKVDRYSNGHLIVAQEIFDDEVFDYKFKWGVINDHGEELVPCQYDSIILREDGYFEFEIEGKKGLFDPNFNLLVKPMFSEITKFSFGLARAVKDLEKYVIDTTGAYAKVIMN